MIIKQSLKKHSSLPNWYIEDKLSEDIIKWCRSYHTYNWILIIIILIYIIVTTVYIFIMGVFDNNLSAYEIKKIIKYVIGFLTIWVLYMILSNIMAPQIFYMNEKMYKIYKKIPKGTWLFLIVIILIALITIAYFVLLEKYKIKINTIIYFIFSTCPLIVFICFEIYIRYHLKQCEKMFENKDTDTIIIDQDGVVTANKI